jgi:hypothetical protein
VLSETMLFPGLPPVETAQEGSDVAYTPEAVVSAGRSGCQRQTGSGSHAQVGARGSGRCEPTATPSLLLRPRLTRRRSPSATASPVAATPMIPPPARGQGRERSRMRSGRTPRFRWRTICVRRGSPSPTRRAGLCCWFSRHGPMPPSGRGCGPTSGVRWYCTPGSASVAQVGQRGRRISGTTR